MNKEENSLTIFTRAAQMLAQADTIQKTKELKSMALTALEWAKRKKMGKEAEQHCFSYALEAERKMGEMLAVTERANTARDKKKAESPDITPVPTLAELGITKNESSKAQMLAKISEKTFEELKTRKLTIHRVKKELKAEIDKAELDEAQKKITKSQREKIESICDIRFCSCAELFASGVKPDAVITDPPYPKEFIHLFTGLAECCANAKIPLVAVMSGQTYLPEVMERLCKHLAYRWTVAYLTPGGQSVQQFPCKVNCFWKPVLLFGEALEWIGDVATSKPNDNDKRFHGWGQSESGMLDLVERLTKPNQLVCDPFLGGGTTALVSLVLGRRFVGCDIDNDMVKKARQRIETVLCPK